MRQPPDNFILNDRFIFGYLEPLVDRDEETQLIAWNHIEGQTSMRFTRPRLSSDFRDVNLTSSSPCPYFMFVHDPGSVDGRGVLGQHNEPPIIYGPVCVSSCSGLHFHNFFF